MAESLVLRYPLNGDAHAACEWIVVDSHGIAADTAGRGSLADAAAALGGRRLVVLVPGAEVTLATPTVPTRNASRLQKLVPFALEEHIATDIESMHFALGRVMGDSGVEVAAVARSRLQGWLDALAGAGLVPALLAADSLAVPDNPAHVVLLLDGGRLVVRRPGGLPLTLDATPLGAALSVAGLPQQAGDEPRAPAHVILYASPADWAGAEPVFEALRGELASLNVQLLADGPLGLLAAGAVANPPLSLLQGAFTVRQGLAAEWPRWRLAASLVAALIVVHAATLGIDGWRLHQDEVRLDQQLRTLAAEALPDVQNPARLPSVRLAVESRVRKSRAAATEGLLGTLGNLGAAVTAAPGAQIVSLSYRDGTTDLTIAAPDVGTLDRLQEAARSHGYDAQLQGAAQKDKSYEGHMQLKGPGS
jgi:general secretion pathway protein L